MDEMASRRVIDELLCETFSSILRIEERVLDNRLTHAVSITEIHTIVAIGLYKRTPMNVVARRLGVTVSTLTVGIGKLVEKGFVTRRRCPEDRRKVLISLTKTGRQVLRVHNAFHRQMVDEALEGLSSDEQRVLTCALTRVKAFFEAQTEGLRTQKS